MGGTKRKRQSRLTFTPVPSSSPAAKGYNKQIQDRAATVCYDGSPSPEHKRRRRETEAAGAMQLDGVNDDIPTPAATMEQQEKLRTGDVDMVESEDSEPVRSTQRRLGTGDKPVSSKKRSRQQSLDFSRVRDSDTFDPLVRLSSPLRSSGKPSMFSQGKRKRSAGEVSSDESDSEERLEDIEEILSKKKRPKRTLSQGPVVIDSDEEEDSIVVQGSRKAQKPAADAQDEDSDSGVAPPSTRKRQPVIDVESGESDGEDMPTTDGRKPRVSRRRRSNSFISSSPPRMVESDDDLEIIEPASKCRRGCRQHRNSNDEDENDPKSTGRSRLKRRQQLSQQDQDDLAEDLDFLGPSSDVEALTRTPRTTQTIQKDARKAALERLKRQRSRQPQLPTVNEVEPSNGDGEEASYGDEDEESEKQLMPRGTQRMRTRDLFRANEDDADFIEAGEEDEVLGVPEGIPIEFTQYARMKAKDLFKYAVDWMVQKKINPGFQKTDEVYGLTFRKLDDEVKGLAGSKFTSAAWTPDFTMTLKSRPDIAFEPLDREGEHYLRGKCDACNRSGHPATFQIQFQGKPYNPSTLDEVGAEGEDSDGEDDDDSSSSSSSNEDDDDQPAYDYQGREVPPASTIFYVGKFCMANAETAHSLSHWKIHLYEWVVEWLNGQGYNRPEKVVKRDGMSAKKRRKEANRIFDRMEREGVVKSLWKDFRENIDQARSSKQSGRWAYDSP
jgi:hypothetical protein